MANENGKDGRRRSRRNHFIISCMGMNGKEGRKRKNIINNYGATGKGDDWISVWSPEFSSGSFSVLPSSSTAGLAPRPSFYTLS